MNSNFVGKHVLRFSILRCVSKIVHFCTVGKRMKFATKPTRHYPPHLGHIATLPWDITNANFLQIFSTYTRKMQCSLRWGG